MKRKGHWLLIPGVLLLLAGLIGLYSGPKLCQYVFLPGEKEYSQQLTEIEKKWDSLFPVVSLHGVAENISLTAGERTQEEVTLYEVMGGYSEVYPRRYVAGRSLSRGDAGSQVIVLDEALAFQLFQDQEPTEQAVTLNGMNYQVVGVATHEPRIGETGSYAAWIPLGVENEPACTVMILSVDGKENSNLWTQFEIGAREVFGAGQVFFLSKECMRGTILLRVCLMVLAIRLMTVWVRKMSRWIKHRVQEVREQLKTRYPRQMMGMLLSRTATAILLIAMMISVGVGLVVWATQPMQIFPEWVPEVLTDPDSIIQRFWELTAAAADSLQFRTPELAEIRFWSGMLRWGLFLMLLSTRGIV